MPLPINAQRKLFLSEGGKRTEIGSVICDFLFQYFAPNKTDSDSFGSVICDFVFQYFAPNKKDSVICDFWPAAEMYPG